jgi:hypothetical protein
LLQTKGVLNAEESDIHIDYLEEGEFGFEHGAMQVEGEWLKRHKAQGTRHEAQGTRHKARVL